MEKAQTLAEFLGTDQKEGESSSISQDSVYAIPDNLTAKQFAKRFLNSLEFRRYIVNMLTLGELPPAITIRMMDYAEDWGKPAEHVKVDAPPVTEVRLVVVRPQQLEEEEPIDVTPRLVTH